MSTMRKIELVCPAGDWASLHAAVKSGADSVYFGVKGINMRNLASNFDLLELPKVMAFLKEHSCKGYCALNVIVFDHELSKIKKILVAGKESGVDAVILWDMAVLSMAKEIGLPIHLSTQASVANSEAVAFFAGLGMKRLIMARECSLQDLARIAAFIRENDLPCQLEAFIHGAMCISVSGRCFLSQYSYGKSANRGQCIQPCRREFEIRDVQEDETYILGHDYVLSPKDLCSIDFIDQLITSGIAAFKIEGRMRSPEYVGVVVGVYREAIDAFYEGKLDDTLKSQLKKRLSTVYNRGFSSGFYFGLPQDATSVGLEQSYQKVFLGEVTRFFKKISVAQVRLRTAGLTQGEQLLFVGKHTPALLAVAEQLQQEHVFIQQAAKGDAVGVKVPFAVRPHDKVFLWRRKEPLT